jgi:glycosyltransferase involved in cell wall biosynthesis
MKVAILYDVLGWAYHSEALGLQKYLLRNKPGVIVDLFSYPYFYEKLERKIKNSYDCVMLYPRQAKNVTFKSERTAVRFSSFGDYSTQAKLNTDNFGHFICMNKQIEAIAKEKLPHRIEKISHIPVAIDAEIFRNTGKRSSKKLNIGFSGNSARKGKGFGMISQTMESLGGKVNFKKALHKRDERVAREDMYKFYNDLDLIVCMSNLEGGPLPPFEAGACGVPTISSCKKSAIDEFLIDDYNGFIIDRSSEALTRKIIELDKNRDLLEVCSKNVQSTIKENYTWGKVWEDYYNVFLKI